MAGPVEASDVTISTSRLNRVLDYEPRDLTVSVEAGIPWNEFTNLLGEHGQMVPLDPPFADSATVGGIVAANLSGPRRRLYGSVRDMVIGMTFATLEGKLVKTGGMVVKNVAGSGHGQAHDRIVRHAGGHSGGEFQAASEAGRDTHVQAGVRTRRRNDRGTRQDSEKPDSSLAPWISSNPRKAIDLAGSSGRQPGGAGPLLARAECVPNRWTKNEEFALWRRPARIHAATSCAIIPTAPCCACLARSLKLATCWNRFPTPALARAGSGFVMAISSSFGDLRLPALGTSVVEFAPQKLSRNRRAVAAARQRFCDDEEGQGNVRPAGPSEPRQVVWPHLMSRRAGFDKPSNPIWTAACTAGFA